MLGYRSGNAGSRKEMMMPGYLARRQTMMNSQQQQQQTAALQSNYMSASSVESLDFGYEEPVEIVDYNPAPVQQSSRYAPQPVQQAQQQQFRQPASSIDTQKLAEFKQRLFLRQQQRATSGGSVAQSIVPTAQVAQTTAAPVEPVVPQPAAPAAPAAAIVKEIEMLDKHATMIESMQKRIDALEAAAASKDLEHKLDLRFQELKMALRNEDNERNKLSVRITALQNDIAQLRQVTHNPAAFQDEIKRNFKDSEERIFSLFTEKAHELEQQSKEIMKQVDSTKSEVVSIVEELLQQQSESFYNTYGTVVAENLAILSAIPSAENEAPDVLHTAVQGDRVYLAYPMVQQPETNNIYMSTKIVDAKGTVTFGAVMVYDAAKSERTISQFAV